MIPYMLYDIPDEVLIKVKAKRDKPNKDANSLANNGSLPREKIVMSDVEWYNKHVRKEGQPVLDLEQYAALRDDVMKKRNKIIEHKYRAQYPLRPDEAHKLEPVLMPLLDPKLAPKLVGTKGKLETKGINEAFTTPDGASASGEAPSPFFLKPLLASCESKLEPEIDLKEEKEKLRQDSITDGVIADVKEKYIEKDIEEKWEDMKAMEERLHFKSDT